MTEREYRDVLDVVETAINAVDAGPMVTDPGTPPMAANDNQAEWPVTPFPEGWHASP